MLTRDSLPSPMLWLAKPFLQVQVGGCPTKILSACSFRACQLAKTCGALLAAMMELRKRWLGMNWYLAAVPKYVGRFIALSNRPCPDYRHRSPPRRKRSHYTDSIRTMRISRVSDRWTLSPPTPFRSVLDSGTLRFWRSVNFFFSISSCAAYFKAYSNLQSFSLRHA